MTATRFDTTFIPAPSPTGDAPCASVDELYRGYEGKVYRRVDRLFFILMGLQWLVGILFALVVSPRTWSGAHSSVHPHVIAAVVLGGLFCFVPMLLIWRRPGQAVTRHVVAIGQVCFSGLLIHLSGGRIETHFHVFGSLAFLACYRNWKVLLTATAIIAVDHLVRGIWYPESVYGVLFSTAWRSLEHAGWVIFEDIVLIWSCFVSRREMRSTCEHQFQNQELLEGMELRVRERTSDLEAEVIERQRAESSLRASEERYRTLVENAPIGIYRITPGGRVEMANPALAAMLRLGSVEELVQHYSGQEANTENSSRAAYFECIHRDGEVRGYETVWKRFDGSEMHVRENAKIQRNAEGDVLFYEGTVEDITERRQAEREMKDLNAQLVEASRHAGMAEVATGVLHNVGNVLNSVNVSTGLIREKLEHSRILILKKAVSVLREQGSNLAGFLTCDEKGRRFPDFIFRLGDHLVDERRALLEETGALEKNVQHIKQIVAMQQSFARVFGVTERLDAQSLMEEAVQFNIAGFKRHRIEIVRQYHQTPAVLVEPHRVLQILINLLRNAKHSLRDSSREDKTITLAISETAGGRVRFAVSDNGVGIPQENLTMIFRHGFTTKKDGHGFGLHSGALAAQEMKGALRACSEGPGLGATFTLELPAADREMAA